MTHDCNCRKCEKLEMQLTEHIIQVEENHRKVCHELQEVNNYVKEQYKAYDETISKLKKEAERYEALLNVANNELATQVLLAERYREVLESVQKQLKAFNEAHNKDYFPGTLKEIKQALEGKE